MPNGNNATTGTAGVIAAIPLAVGLGMGMIGDGPTPAPPPLPTLESLSLSQADRVLVEEHVFGGLPSAVNLHVRNGYVRSYDAQNRVPHWVAYHVIQEYRDTPPRQGRFATFRTDRDVDNPVGNREYVGLLDGRGYARGHLAPYAVMGGDRDNDGVTAEDDPDSFGGQTVFQANFMSNIAPQHHDGFNNNPGLWGKLERFIQDDLVAQRNLEVWVFAGTIFGPGEPERVGPDNDIGVPPMFFKIVIREGDANSGSDMPRVLAFLFPHPRAVHGDLEDHLVSVDGIEALTGLDFFNEFGEEVQRALEDTDTFENWEGFAPP